MDDKTVLTYEIPEDGMERVEKLEEIFEEVLRLLEDARWDVKEDYVEDDDPDEFGFEDDEI